MLGIPAQGLVIVGQALHRQNHTLSPEFFIFLLTALLTPKGTLVLTERDRDILTRSLPSPNLTVPFNWILTTDYEFTFNGSLLVLWGEKRMRLGIWRSCMDHMVLQKCQVITATLGKEVRGQRSKNPGCFLLCS